MTSIFYVSYIAMWMLLLIEGFLLLLVYRHFGLAALGTIEGVQRDRPEALVREHLDVVAQTVEVPVGGAGRGFVEAEVDGVHERVADHQHHDQQRWRDPQVVGAMLAHVGPDGATSYGHASPASRGNWRVCPQTPAGPGAAAQSRVA